VQFVDIPGAITEGETIEECLFNAAEALTGVIESYKQAERGEFVKNYTIDKVIEELDTEE